MDTIFVLVIIALIVFFICELYSYRVIEKTPNFGKMNLNYPKNGSKIDIDNWGIETATSMSCSGDLDLSNWDTSDIIVMVTIKNIAYIDYCKKNGLDVHRFNFAKTGLITYAKETEHPKLFDGSLD